MLRGGVTRGGGGWGPHRRSLNGAAGGCARPALGLATRRSFGRWHGKLTGLKKAPPAPPAMSTAAILGSAFVGSALFGVGLATAIVINSKDEVADCDPRCSCARRVEKFGELSETYDSTVGKDETVMGLFLLRWWLLRSARGSVLEVAAGTGSNIGWYPSHCSEVTLTDASASMVAVAQRKVSAEDKYKAQYVVRRMGVGDAAKYGAAYDTVVDAFGLCSFDDAVDSLRAMQRACRANGVVLLLEHGRSHYGWLNDLLDKYASRHLERWGCSWNRDIVGICAEAGLEVQTMRRFHFGTTYFIIAAPHPSLAAKADHAAKEADA
ncbi:S-adenosyl-L-methionine-dependent methyltransferase [Pelagophyceae sp. CCMP2097]|nr:S-adenosyl-L-methionine-dependent methyltransferase [Pelagophyceae sp. CCMP2097]